MSSTKFSGDFKRDGVAQITERGYPVKEVAGGQPPAVVYFNRIETDQQGQRVA